MLPINLLPNYYGDKQKKINAWIGMGVLLVGVVGLMAFLLIDQSNKLAAATEEKKIADDFKVKYDEQVSKISKVKSKIADIQTKQLFIANSQKYNDAWPEAYDLTRNLTSNDVRLNSMAFTGPDHKTIKLAVFAASEEVMYQWWKQLVVRKDVFDKVSFEFLGRPWAPDKPAAGGAAGSAGMPGSGGMPGSYGMPGSGGMGGGKGPSVGSISMPGAPGSFGVPGSGGGGSGSSPVGPTEIEGRPGINFNVTLVLKKPLDEGAAAPSWPGGGGAPAAGGGMPGVPSSGGRPGGGPSPEG